MKTIIGILLLPPLLLLPASARAVRELPFGKEARQILELVYAGRSDEAADAAQRFLARHPDHPLPYLIKARVLRENLSDQDDDKELIRRSAAPIYPLLQKAIRLAGVKAEQGSIYRFYRGWAWMFKAQLDALGAKYWSAGRAAKKGKKDLESFLRSNPDDPDAKGMLGTFLYFADTLPAVLKFIKALLFIPGGDRDKGLAYLDYASSHPGLLTTDHAIVLAAIDVIFEGKFEEGVAAFSRLLARHPRYLRLLEPMALVAPFSPRDLPRLRLLQDRILASVPSQEDLPVTNRLLYHRSFAAMFFGSSSEAASGFRRLAANDSLRPDWLVPLSLVNLGVIYANTGHKERARDCFRSVLTESRFRRFHELARKAGKKLGKGDRSVLPPFTANLSLLYLDPERMEQVAEANCSAEDPSVPSLFYLGEARLLRGQYEKAGEAYRKTLALEPEATLEPYQLLAAVRLAEIEAERGNFRRAAAYLDKALDFYHKEFLLDLLIKGRKKHFEHLAAESSLRYPSLLSAGLAISLP